MNKYIVIFLLAITIIPGCKSKESITQVPVKTETRIIEKLVPVTLPADSSNIVALFKCDSTNQVIMQQLNESKTNRISTQVVFKNGQFRYSTKTTHDTIFIKGKETTLYKEVPVELVKYEKVNELTFWQKLQMYLGRLLCLIALIYIVRIVVKWYLKA